MVSDILDEKKLRLGKFLVLVTKISFPIQYFFCASGKTNMRTKNMEPDQSFNLFSKPYFFRKLVKYMNMIPI